MQKDDFPVRAIGDRVYARTMSSPIATCMTDALATELAERLNYSDICGFQYPPAPRRIPAEEWMPVSNVGH